MKIFFQYYKTLHGFNLPFSLFISALGGTLDVFLPSFFFSFVLVGLGLSFYFFWVRYPGQYYFYHNRGWSKVALMGGAFLVNFSLYVAYCLAKPYIYGL